MIYSIAIMVGILYIVLSQRMCDEQEDKESHSLSDSLDGREGACPDNDFFVY